MLQRAVPTDIRAVIGREKFKGPGGTVQEARARVADLEKANQLILEANQTILEENSSIKAINNDLMARLECLEVMSSSSHADRDLASG